MGFSLSLDAFVFVSGVFFEVGVMVVTVGLPFGAVFRGFLGSGGGCHSGGGGGSGSRRGLFLEGCHTPGSVTG